MDIFTVNSYEGLTALVHESLISSTYLPFTYPNFTTGTKRLPQYFEIFLLLAKVPKP